MPLPKMTSSSASSIALVAVLCASLVAQAHPTATCVVGSHTTNAANSATEAFSNPRGAAILLNTVVIFDSSDGGLYFTYTDPEISYVPAPSNYWDFDMDYPNGNFLISDQYVAGTSQIVAAKNKFLVTYTESGQAAKSRTLDLDTQVASSAVSIGNVGSVNSTLAGGNSGFYFASVIDNNLNVFVSISGASWTSVDTTAVSTPVPGPLASAVDTVGTYMVVYHTSDSDLACAVLAISMSALVPASVPPVVGSTIALAQGGAGLFLLVANDAGNVSSTVTQTNGTTWGDSQLVESSINVLSTSTVGVIRTDTLWITVFTNINLAYVDERYTNATLPTADDWANNARVTQMKGTPVSIMYSNPTLSASGGAGYIMTATETNSSGVYSRSCFNAPSPTTSPTPAPSAGVVAGMSKMLLALMTFILLIGF